MVFCCIVVVVILVVSILLTIALVSVQPSCECSPNQPNLPQYLRPPAVILNDITVGDTSLTTSGLSIAITLAISVSNPNWFNINFSKIKATATYPGTSVNLGGGTLYDVNFKGHADSSFDFPFQVK